MAICQFCLSEKGNLFTCQKCGKPICADCYNITTMHYCYECSQIAFVEESNAAKKAGCIYLGATLLWIISIVAFAILCMLFSNETVPKWVPLIPMILFLLIGFYPAWQFVKSKLQSTGIVSFIIKVILSAIGCFILLPYYVIMSVKYFKISKNALNNFNALRNYPHPDPSDPSKLYTSKI